MLDFHKKSVSVFSLNGKSKRHRALLGKGLDLLYFSNSDVMRINTGDTSSSGVYRSHELKSLRFQLSQQHEELISQTPAAIQKNLQENPHLVRAARSNLKFLKAKVSPHKSPSPSKTKKLSPKKRSSPTKSHTVPSTHAVSFSVESGNQVSTSYENHVNKQEKIEMSPLTAGKRHQNYVKKYRKGVLKSLNKRIGGF